MTREDLKFAFIFIVRQSCFDRLKTIILGQATHLYSVLVNLNIFPLRYFGSNVNQMTAKRLGQWTTRLYIVLLVTGFAILVLYTVVQPQALTKTFDRPSFNFYNHLIQDYGDKLTCPCSLIASPYNLYVKIEPVFHEVRRDICI